MPATPIRTWLPRAAALTALIILALAAVLSQRSTSLSAPEIRHALYTLGRLSWYDLAPLILAALSFHARRNRLLACTVVTFVSVDLIIAVYQSIAPFRLVPALSPDAAEIILSLSSMGHSISIVLLALFYPRFTGVHRLLQWTVAASFLVVALLSRTTNFLHFANAAYAINWIDTLLELFALLTGIYLAYATLFHQSATDPAIEDPLTPLNLTCPRCSHPLTAHPGRNECPSCRLIIHIQLEDARCPTCHYPLRGLPTPTCPECGTTISASA